MLTVRLQRVGRKNDPSFRMVVIDSKRGVKSANYIEMVGSYNPRQKSVDVKADRVKHWIAQGAKPTDTVHNILINEKVIEGKKVNPLGKKTPVVKKKAEKEKPAEAPKAEEKTEEAETKTDEDTPVEEEKKEETPKEKVEEKPEAPKEEPKEDKETPKEEPKEDKKAS